MEYTYSLNGRKYGAVTINSRGIKEIRFNLNILEERHDIALQTNPLDKIFDFDTWLESFIDFLNAIELHELGHVFNWKIGCKKHTKKDGGAFCGWCLEIEKIYYWMHENRVSTLKNRN